MPVPSSNSNIDSDSAENAAEAQADSSPPNSIGRKFTISVSLLILLTMCVFWLISNYNTRNLMEQQANNLGSSLAQQTAILVTELVLANDLVSLNVVLTQLTANAGIVEASVINVDEQVIAVAESVSSSPRSLLPFDLGVSGLEGSYSAPIRLSDSVAGEVILKLDLRYIEVAVTNNLVLIAAATLLLIVISASLIGTYFQYVISFPVRMVSLSLANIRRSEVDTCPEDNENTDISQLIRQYNLTAEYLAQNSFIKRLHNSLPSSAAVDFDATHNPQQISVLCIKLSNYQYLSSTRSEEDMVVLLNKFYFFSEKAAQLYNGAINYCADGEVIISFGATAMDDEQAFYCVCAGQLFIQLIDKISENATDTIHCKFKLATHSGATIDGLYSPLTPDQPGLMGKTLDLVRLVCNDCPDNYLLLTDVSYQNAGGETRISAARYSTIDDEQATISFLSREAMPGFSELIERQAQQLEELYEEKL